ncbi:MAG: helix-turn-helix transcriptional regulator [Nocardioidaceae bacterium]
MARLHATIRSAVGLQRRRRRLTQRQLGDLVGVSRQTVTELETGDYNPSTALALRLAVVLDVCIQELFWLADDELTQLQERLTALHQTEETTRA